MVDHPLPWRPLQPEGDQNVYIVDANGDQVIRMCHGVIDVAARVACSVNVCDGIDSDRLKTMPRGFMRTMSLVLATGNFTDSEGGCCD